MLPNFYFSTYKFDLELSEEISTGFFLGNTLRGAFGKVLRNICCIGEKETCTDCPLAPKCAYQYIFSSIWLEEYGVLSKNQNIVRGFIIKPPFSDIKTRHLSFQMVLMGRLNKWLPYIIVPFKELGKVGLGYHRIPFSLSKISIFDFKKDTWESIYSGKDELVRPKETAVTWADLVKGLKERDEVSLNFLTPTSLKHNPSGQKGESIQTKSPEFHILIKRLRDRINALLKMVVFAFFKRMMSPHLVSSNGEKIAKFKYESIFGKESWKENKSQLDIAKHMAKAIDPFWSLPGSNFGFTVTTIEELHPHKRIEFLIEILNGIASEVYKSIPNFPSRKDFSINMAREFINDLIKPSKEINTEEIAKTQMEVYSKSKPFAGKEAKNGEYICPM